MLSVGLFLLLWELLSMVLANDFLFPSVKTVCVYLFDLLQTDTFYKHLFYTLLRAVECLLFTFLPALPLSYLIYRSSVADKLLFPFLYFMKTTPVISFLLLALIWLSSENVPLFIAFIGMLPILVIHITTGFRSVDQRLAEMASVYKLSAFRKFIYIEYPVLKSHLFAGMSGALGLGWRAIIIGEALASVPYGLGAAMKQAQNYVDVPYLFAVTLISLLASYLIELLLKGFTHIRIHRIFSLQRRRYTGGMKSRAEDDVVLAIRQMSFSRRDKKIFDRLDLTLHRGEILLLKGASGIGKSTLIDLIAGFETNFEGAIKKANISVLFQENRLCLWLTVREHLDLYLPREVPEEDIRNLCAVMQIADHLDKYPGELSGGELQRINLMITLLYPADLYILDEPLTGIGESQKMFLLNWLRDYLKEHDYAVLWVSHDSDQLIVADRIFELQKEKSA